MAALCVVWGAPGRAQDAGPGGRCIIDYEGSQAGRTTRVTSTKLPSGKYNAFIGGGFIGHCRGQDVTLLSDSAEYFGDNNLLHLIDHVHYREPRATIDAQTMTYWTVEGHLHAEGNVYGVLKSGTTMRGPSADYYRVLPGVRTQPMLVAVGRPHLDVVQRDSVTGKISDTVHVLANHITSIGDTLTYAGGDVHITRPELLATGDSGVMSNGSGRARLIGHPHVEARRSRPFTLTGGIIDVFATNRQVDRVVASPNGHATSQDLQLDADSIDLRVHANTLQRAMAWGKNRAHAVAPDRDLIADSIDAILPDQRLRELRAVRNAYATSTPDTATIVTRDRDWMQGDTIIATFDTLAPGDTAHTPPIRMISARTQARAYYHVTNDDDKRRPGVNYVRGRVINVAFHQNAVQTVTVVDRASGVYLEPATDTVPPPAGRPGRPTPLRRGTSTPTRPRGR